MGGRSGRNRRATQFDPNAFPYEEPYYGSMQPRGGFGMPPGGYGMPQPPPYPYQRGGFGPTGGYGGYGEYDPDDIYGEYGYGMTDPMETYYGGPMRRGGRYGPGKFQLDKKFIFRICV
jgi:hypothetical protein